MASVQEQLKLKRAPTDVWNVKEQLCLASSVLKSGDQNWMSVSRSLKSMVDKDSTRPPDWFSQKSCAQQYSYLLENIEMPRRKKRESGETTDELIVRRLTEDRITELQKIVSQQKEEYLKLKNEVSLMRNGTISEEKLKKIWLSIQEEENQKLPKSETSSDLTNNCQLVKESTSIQDPSIKSIQEKVCQETSKSQEDTNDDHDKKPKPKSSLLTSLLESKNSTSMQVSQISTAVAKANDITPKESNLTNKSDDLLQPNKLDTVSTSTTIEDKPSSSAPTLSMLLEQPSVCNQKILQQQLKTSVNLAIKNLPTSSKSQNTIKTRSSMGQDDDTKVVELQETVNDEEESEVPPSSTEQTVQKEKDASNQMDMDLEMTIEEESDAVDLDPAEDLERVDTKNTINELSSPTNLTEEQSRDKKIDSSSSSKFSECEISLSEIDSSSIKIAEIIGTSIENIQPEANITKSSDETEKMSNDSIMTESSEECKSPTKEIDDPLTDPETSLNISSKSECGDPKLHKNENNPNDSALDSEKVDFCESIDNGNSKKEEKLEEKNSEVEKIDKLNANSTNSTSEKLLKDPDSKTSTTVKSKNDKDDSSDTKVSKENKISETKKSSQNLSEVLSKENEIKEEPADSVKSGSQSSKKCDKEEMSTEVSNCKSTPNLNKEIKTEIEDSEIKIESKESKDDQDSKDVKKCEAIDDKKELQSEKVKASEEAENPIIKEEPMESVENLDEEEPTLGKLSGGRAMKTYSKKQNATLDSESENDTGGETADYRAWKKSVMLIYNKLATHKYASKFLRPITEDQAPGYHSIVYKPMDLGSIKKNIDNGSVRTTSHFQRDVMLMFQNAIMFNKHQTHVHKMTLEMQEDYLQHLQVLTRASGESSFRRETRTAANSSNETTEIGLKRKWSHNTSFHDSDSPRLKKRRKSEND